MKVLIEHPLPPNVFVAVRTLSVGDGFLRIAGPDNATQPDFWILSEKDTVNDEIKMFNPIDGGYLQGVSGNTPVVPYPSVVVPIHLQKM